MYNGCEKQRQYYAVLYFGYDNHSTFQVRPLTDATFQVTDNNISCHTTDWQQHSRSNHWLTAAFQVWPLTTSNIWGQATGHICSVRDSTLMTVQSQPVGQECTVDSVAVARAFQVLISEDGWVCHLQFMAASNDTGINYLYTGGRNNI